ASSPAGTNASSPAGANASSHAGAKTGAAAALAFAALLAGALAPGPARAELPGPELLAELRERLARPPACHPACAALPRLAVARRDGELRLRFEAHAAARTAVPVPGAAGGAGAAFAPVEVRLDDRFAAVARQPGDPTLWVLLEPGVSELLLAAPVAADATRIEIPLPLRPAH